MSFSWYVLAVATVLTIALAVFQTGNVASIHQRYSSYDTDVVLPGDAPAAPLSRIEFWAMFLPLVLLVIVLMNSLARLVFSISNGWKYIHMGVSVLWLLASLILVIWLCIVILPDCNTTALNICSDERYCCKNQVIAPAVNPAPGCPIFLSACDPDQTTATLTWNAGFTWLFVLLWIDVLFALLHVVLSWWVGSNSPQWVVDSDYKPVAMYAQVSDQVESGLPAGPMMTPMQGTLSYRSFTPVATSLGGNTLAAKHK